MSVISAQKVFIEAEDEMNFVIEKILKAERDRVILVIPTGALITSSLISIKVLAKQVVQSNKLLTIVTEDQFAKKLAEQSGLVVVKKVSDISPNIWERVRINKERDAELLKKHEQRLIRQRKESDSEELPPVAKETEEVEVATEEVATEAVSAKSVEKGRISPKVVNLDGIEIIAGGDIADFQTAAKFNSEMMIKPEAVAEQPTVPANTTEVPTKVDFIGRDWTGARAKKRPLQNPFPALWQKLKRQKVVYLVALGVVLIVSAVILLILNANAEVVLQLKTADVPVSQEISAQTDVKSLDSEKLVLHAQEIASSDVSRSASGAASGVGKTGNKAAGLISISNSGRAVTVPAGSKIISVQTGLKYLVTTATPVEAGTVQNPVTTPSSIRVEAESFGDQYNIDSSSTTNSIFTFETKGFENLKGIRFGAFTGGTTQQITVVSQKDLDTVKNTIINQVKEAAFADLVTKIPAGYTILDGSQIFQELSVTSLPALNEQAGNFDLSLFGKATALVVSNDELRQVAQILVQRTQNTNEKFEISSLDLPKVTAVTRQGGIAKFKLVAAGVVQSQVDSEKIKADLLGRNVTQAREYLSGIEQIKGFAINYSASILPESLQILPRDTEKLKLSLK